MADDFSAGWERKSLYYYPQTTWGTFETSVNFVQIRETSKSFPYIPAPVIPPQDAMGRGLPYLSSGDYRLGQQAGSFQTTHPMTQTVVRDLVMLLFNGKHYDIATGDVSRMVSPLAADNSVVWSPTLSKFASVAVENDEGSGPVSALKATSCVISQLDFTIPQSTPGETSGIAEVTATWMCEKAVRATTVALGTESRDTGEFFFTKDFTMKLGGSARDFVSANFSITNGAQWDLQPASTPGGIIFGQLGWTGSLTCYLNEATGEAGATTDDLLDALEGPTQVIVQFIWSAGETDEIIWELPIIVTGPPALGDIGGIQSMTFNFGPGGDADSPIRIEFEDNTAFDAGLFN